MIGHSAHACMHDISYAMYVGGVASQFHEIKIEHHEMESRHSIPARDGILHAHPVGGGRGTPSARISDSMPMPLPLHDR